MHDLQFWLDSPSQKGSEFESFHGYTKLKRVSPQKYIKMTYNSLLHDHLGFENRKRSFEKQYFLYSISQ